MTDVRTALQYAARELSESGSPTPRLDADVLLMHFLGTDQPHLLTQSERELTEAETAGFESRIARRKRGEPVSYILGEKEFWSLAFEVGPTVLIPRPETECLIEEALRYYSPPGEGLRIIDIGAGSGVIGIVLARELSGAWIVATDISPEALAIARRNAAAHGVSERIEFMDGDLFAESSGEFDIICSNPPYIAQEAYGFLSAGIREFEPRGALLAEENGTAFHRRIILEGVYRLKPGGRIFMEIGDEQREAVAALFETTGAYDKVSFRKDYAGLDRVVSARKQ